MIGWIHTRCGFPDIYGGAGLGRMQMQSCRCGQTLELNRVCVVVMEASRANEHAACLDESKGCQVQSHGELWKRA